MQVSTSAIHNITIVHIKDIVTYNTLTTSQFQQRQQHDVKLGWLGFKRLWYCCSAEVMKRLEASIRLFNLPLIPIFSFDTKV